LIDIEFTGLDNTFQKDNEIVQLKLMDADSGAGVCVNYKSLKPVSLYHQINEGMNGKYRGRTYFSKESFAKALCKIGINWDDPIKYFGYSVGMDRSMLLKYGLDIGIIDLQELIRLNPMYENELAMGCASMETAYLLLTGKKPLLKSHMNLTELGLIREIYREVSGFSELNELLTLMPYGHCAGMPITQYVSEFRRSADGYRFNNTDLLAKSLTARIAVYVFSSWDDHDVDEDEEQ